MPGTTDCAATQPPSCLASIENIPARTEKPEILTGASAEIADIDQRLHALQTFLKAAKAGGPGKS